MKSNSFKEWLRQQGISENGLIQQEYRARRVEDEGNDHVDLDISYEKDRLTSLIETLTYSTDDKRRNRPNPSKIKIDGDIWGNLNCYRNAVKQYKKFLESSELDNTRSKTPDDQDSAQKISFGLEKDLQAALRVNIKQLEAGLTIIDDGAERSVESGFIDITARDASGTTVVIELKAVPARREAIGQILSYMGDVTAEEDNRKVRGILVASDFDSKAKAAARMVPNLILRKYSVQFQFSDGHE